MSGCHEPKINSKLHCPHGVSHFADNACPICIPTSSEGYKELIEKVDLHWHMNYKSLENLSKRIGEWSELHNDLARSINSKLEQFSDHDERIDDLEKIGCEQRLIAIEQNYPQLWERLKKIEEAYKADYETAKDVIFNGAQTHASILRCEAELKRFQDITQAQYQKVTKNKEPHKCPICEGSGFNAPEFVKSTATMTIDGIQCQVGDGFYSKSSCRACEGKGIVWG